MLSNTGSSLKLHLEPIHIMDLQQLEGLPVMWSPCLFVSATVPTAETNNLAALPLHGFPLVQTLWIPLPDFWILPLIHPCLEHATDSSCYPFLCISSGRIFGLSLFNYTTTL